MRALPLRSQRPALAVTDRLDEPVERLVEGHLAGFNEDETDVRADEECEPRIDKPALCGRIDVGEVRDRGQDEHMNRVRRHAVVQRGDHRSTPCRRRNPSAWSILSVVSTAAPARRSASWHSTCNGESLRPGALISMNSAWPERTSRRSGAPARTPSDLKIAPSIAVLAPPF